MSCFRNRIDENVALIILVFFLNLFYDVTSKAKCMVINMVFEISVHIVFIHRSLGINWFEM